MKNNFYELNKSKSVLFADRNALVAFMSVSENKILHLLYEDVFATPETCLYFTKVLDIESLKIFKRNIKQAQVYKTGSGNKAELGEIRMKNSILTKDEAEAIFYCRNTGTDIIIDDPFKAKICESYGINTLRPSDIVTAAAVTMTRG